MSRVPTLLLCLALLGSCERRKGGAENMKKAEDWGAAGDPTNPHAEVAPQDDPHAGVDMGGGGGDPHAGVDMGGGGDPHGNMEPPPDRQIDPNKYLSGRMVLTDATQGKVPPGAVIFLSAKAPTGGPPLAVERIEVGAFPMEFRLDEVDQMIAGTAFAGPVVITARVDQDSDVGTRQPGDLSGTLEATIPAGGLELKLDTVEP
jgi:hypothetical protein